MALSDLILRAKVNMALVRDPLVSPLDIGVRADEGVITLTGAVDLPAECRAAEDIARRVDGVRVVDNQLTCNEGNMERTSDFLAQKFLDKLEEEWNELPEQTALAQADYLKWALWMIYKFHIPSQSGANDTADALADATDDAIRQVARRIGTAPALVALELQRVATDANPMFQADGPRLEHADLSTSPLTDEGNTELAA